MIEIDGVCFTDHTDTMDAYIALEEANGSAPRPECSFCNKTTCYAVDDATATEWTGKDGNRKRSVVSKKFGPFLSIFPNSVFGYANGKIYVPMTVCITCSAHFDAEIAWKSARTEPNSWDVKNLTGDSRSVYYNAFKKRLAAMPYREIQKKDPGRYQMKERPRYAE